MYDLTMLLKRIVLSIFCCSLIGSCVLEAEDAVLWSLEVDGGAEGIGTSPLVCYPWSPPTCWLQPPPKTCACQPIPACCTLPVAPEDEPGPTDTTGLE